ncbi:MAG: thrombospondin type 3 repeat-containing protein [Pseudomonadales bacterium]|nr:thrombospondin type 3 repeat-containing protein [Pseudomonadales bacterium]
MKKLLAIYVLGIYWSMVSISASAGAGWTNPMFGDNRANNGETATMNASYSATWCGDTVKVATSGGCTGGASTYTSGCGGVSVSPTITMTQGSTQACKINIYGDVCYGCDPTHRGSVTVKVNQTVNLSGQPTLSTVGASHVLVATAKTIASAGSSVNTGRPVTLSSKTTAVCTVSGTTVSSVGVGTCTIKATVVENSNLVGVTKDFTWSVTTPPDADNDGTPDHLDNCPNDDNGPNAGPNNQLDTDGDGQGNVCDSDDDNDGLLDGVDANPTIKIGSCLDTDNDGAPNIACSGMTGDSDDDGDGILDAAPDNCPLIVNTDQADNYPGAGGDVCGDSDSDSVIDINDNCPLLANDQTDLNSNDIGDACEDGDGDGAYDQFDNCPVTANADQSDLDLDGIGDACDPSTIDPNDFDGDGDVNAADNCPNTYNPDQLNTDGDAEGNVCDSDDDNDSVVDAADNCPLISNSDQADLDADNIGNVCDGDDDNDGALDNADNCPLIVNADQADTDADGIGNVCELDSDGDGFADDNAADTDNCPAIANADQADADADNIGDVCELDSDADGVADDNGINDTDNCTNTPNPLQEDANFNQIGDVCEAVFVKTQATGAGDCMSWADACADIQQAVNQAKIVDAINIFVQQGIYHPAASIAINAGLTLAGGFSGNETRIAEAKPATNITIISGDSADVLVINTAAKSGGNLPSLLSVNIGSTAYSDQVTLSGLILNAAGSATAADGAALKVSHSRVTLTAMQFVANEAINGAAMLVDSASIVELSNSVFSENAAADKAGAIMLKGNSTQLEINRSLFKSNRAAIGGAIYTMDGSNVEVTDSEFELNNVTSSAAAIAITSSSGVSSIKRSLFISNHSAGMAAALSVEGAGMVNMSNLTLAKNSAYGDGGALYIKSNTGGINLNYVTLSGNSSAAEGGAIYVESGATLNLARSLLVGNTANSEASGHNLYLQGSLNDEGFNLLGYQSNSGVKPDGLFVPVLDPLVSSYTGSFTTDVTSLSSIVSSSASYSGADDVTRVSATRTLALVKDSVARDVMTLTECGVINEDQRGENRKDNMTGMCDIGAYEYTSISCAAASQAIRESGNYYLANCNPANKFILDFGTLKGGAINIMFLLSLGLLACIRFRIWRLV